MAVTLNNRQQGCIGILARCGSKRLHDKHLLEINGQPVISYLIQRLKNEFYKEISKKQLEIFILTGNQKTNQRLADVAYKYEISVYFGHDLNIPLRMVDLIKNKKFDFILSVDGDDPLCSPEGMRKVYDDILAGNQYVKTVDYPFGMNSMGISKTFIENSLKGKENKRLETGWGWIFNENQCKIIKTNIIQDKRLRFTLDYSADYKFFNKIICSLDPIDNLTSSEIIEYVVKKKIYLENTHLNKDYWENFNTQKLLEMTG